MFSGFKQDLSFSASCWTLKLHDWIGVGQNIHWRNLLIFSAFQSSLSPPEDSLSQGSYAGTWQSRTFSQKCCELILPEINSNYMYTIVIKRIETLMDNKKDILKVKN